VIIPAENRASAVSVIAPSIMLMMERGFFSTWKEKMAASPAKKKAAEDTAPCGRVKSLVKMPTPMAAMAIRSSSMFSVLKLRVCLRKYVPKRISSPRRKTDELKTRADGPTPRSLT